MTAVGPVPTALYLSKFLRVCVHAKALLSLVLTLAALDAHSNVLESMWVDTSQMASWSKLNVS